MLAWQLTPKYFYHPSSHLRKSFYLSIMNMCCTKLYQFGLQQTSRTSSEARGESSSRCLMSWEQTQNATGSSRQRRRHNLRAPFSTMSTAIYSIKCYYIKATLESFSLMSSGPNGATQTSARHGSIPHPSGRLVKPLMIRNVSFDHSYAIVQSHPKDFYPTRQLLMLFPFTGYRAGFGSGESGATVPTTKMQQGPLHNLAIEIPRFGNLSVARSAPEEGQIPRFRVSRYLFFPLVCLFLISRLSSLFLTLSSLISRFPWLLGLFNSQRQCL